MSQQNDPNHFLSCLSSKLSDRKVYLYFFPIHFSRLNSFMRPLLCFFVKSAHSCSSRETFPTSRPYLICELYWPTLSTFIGCLTKREFHSQHFCSSWEKPSALLASLLLNPNSAASKVHIGLLGVFPRCCTTLKRAFLSDVHAPKSVRSSFLSSSSGASHGECTSP